MIQYKYNRSGRCPVKYCKRFTEGMAYIAGFLVLTFILYSYFKFGKPVTDEETGEMVTFMSQRAVKEYIIMLGMILVPAIIASLTDKLPFIGLLVSVVPVYYVLSVYADKLLVYCPNIIMILTVMFAVGEMVATVQWTRDLIENYRKKHA